MDIRIPWLVTRRKLIFSCINETIIIYLLNTNVFSNSFLFADNEKFFNFFFIVLWVLLSYISGRYSYDEKLFRDKKIILFFKLIIRSFFVSLISIFSYFIVSKNINFNNFIHFDRIIIIYSALISLIINILQIPIINSFVEKTIKEEIWIFIGSNKSFDILIKELEWSKKNIKLIQEDTNINLKKKKFKNVSGIIFNKFDDLEIKDLDKYINFLQNRKKIISLQKFCELNLQRFPADFISNEYFLKGNFSVAHNSYQLRMKRAADIILSILLLTLTLPILILCSIFIILEDRGTVLYKQDRVGFKQKIFTIYKLRTMKMNAEEGVPQWSSKSDNRITNIGSFLRKARLDELPQLISVIKGDMSLIGPRPERQSFDKELKRIIPYYGYRYSVKPGLSGWAQVNFPYGSSIDDSKKKFSYDLFYLRNFSIWIDLLIFLKTIRMVILRRGSISIR